MVRIPRDAYRAALKRAKRWLRREEVLAVGLGLRNRNGELVRDELCVVVTVRWKRSPGLLAKRHEKALPSHIKVNLHDKQFMVPVDVENARGRLAGKLHGIIGTPLVAGSSGGGKRYGMVGAVVEKADTWLVLTAGHVPVENGTAVTVNYPGGSLDGITSEVFLEGNLDHALITPDNSLGPNAKSLPSGRKLAGVRASATVKEQDIVRFYDQDGDEYVVEVLRIDASAPFYTPKGRKNFDHLIVIAARTREGDSGTLLYDSKFLAVGTLVGEYSGSDYFLPCDDSFDAIGVVLA
jgi:hypothetical protein